MDSQIPRMVPAGGSDFFSTSSRIGLSEGQVRLWLVSLNPPQQTVTRFSRLLSSDERRRAEDFFRETDRSRFVVRRGVLRNLLGSYLEINPEHIPFRYNPFGKPRLAESSGRLQFNVGSSGDWALYAFTYNRRIGVDLERIQALPEMADIADRWFSREEAALLRAAEDGRRVGIFFEFWTRREAYLKALGGGVSFSVQLPVNLDLGGPGSSASDTSAAGTLWFYQGFSPLPGYVAAVVAEGPHPRQDYREQPALQILSFDEKINQTGAERNHAA